MPIKKTTKSSAKKVLVKKSVKKTVVKKASKRTPPKKIISKKVKKVVKKTSKIKNKLVKRDLVLASEGTAFWMKDGQILNSLLALNDALDEMEKEVYDYHSGGAQNDFAAWVSAVLCDGECADELEKVKTKGSAKKVVVKHLKLYK